MPASKDIMQPIYLGNGRLLLKLPNGRMLCADGESIDTLDIIMNGDLESDVVGVFLKYLKPDSVVLDIGANFGYYSVLSGPMLSDQGRLYAFEANPRTFSCLERSLMANYQLARPNVFATNVAVGEADGETKFYFETKSLGGASRYARNLDTTQAVTVAMRSIDSFLPPDLRVDLVKIDVEGYEPYVLSGMRQVLERSPGIKIVIEMFPHMLETTYGMAKFQRLVQELGLSACKIMPDSSLQELPLDRPLVDDCYALLTKTPAEDIAHSGRRLELDRFRVSEHGAVFSGNALSWRRSQAIPPNLLFHGPYAFVPSGRYELLLTGALEGPIEFVVQTDLGHTVLGRATTNSLPVSIPFVLDAVTDKLEIVAVVQEHTEALELNMVTLKNQP
ncbi:MAG: Methyltransferase FkbM [Roseomonas sp.]|nr:Methyltransferase FkbM [Roseomonas sp.]